jgi:DNA-directed RNA polymerase alpha subunit
MFLFAAISNAQEVEAKKPTKEEKQKMKQKQDEDLAAAFKEAGLSDEQINKVKAVMDEANAKSKEVKNDATLSDDERKTKLDAIREDKNAKIKEIMGEEKYKAFNAAKKKQKAAAGGN